MRADRFEISEIGFVDVVVAGAEVKPDRDCPLVGFGDGTQVAAVSAQRDRFRRGAMFGQPLRFAPGRDEPVCRDEPPREAQLQHGRREPGWRTSIIWPTTCGGAE